MNCSPCRFFEVAEGVFLRYGVWPVAETRARGRVILLQGRGEFLEKYDQTIQKLNQRGFDVFSFDWRGQGLSTRMLPNRLKGHIETFDSYTQDVSRFIRDVAAGTSYNGPLIMLAHSMGGHIGVRFIHDHPGEIAGAVMVSPMIDILTHPFPRALAVGLARIGVKIGFKRRYVIGSGGNKPAHARFEGNRLTADPVHFRQEKEMISENPKLAVYGVTYGWLDAAFRSIDLIRKNGYAQTIRTPILVVGAGSDRIVSVEAQKTLCAGAESMTFMSIPGARHEILRETDSVQKIFWNAFDDFTGAVT